MIYKFLNDTEELEAYITGGAGTGKTTTLIEIVEKLIKDKVNFLVCAYTHKAKDVLISKLPVLKDEYIVTLHSFLKKRPTINSKATDVSRLLTSKQYGEPETLQLLIVDEFSFIGERDYSSIGELQNYDLVTYKCAKCSNDVEELAECSKCHSTEQVVHTDTRLKVLYVGDPNQLNPVNDVQAIQAGGEYHTHLDIIHRVENEDLLPILNELVELVESCSSEVIAPMNYCNDSVVFVPDLVDAYKESDTRDNLLLAFTNAMVQGMNASIVGRQFPIEGDTIYNYSMKKKYVVQGEVAHKDVTSLLIPREPGFITTQTKYNPIKQLGKIKDIKYYQTDEGIIPCFFGSNRAKILKGNIGKALTAKNKAGKDSRREYATYKTVEDYVSVCDFPYATTIHKAQGSQADEVYLHIGDLLSKCPMVLDINRLLYVAVSRAKKRVYFTL